MRTGYLLSFLLLAACVSCSKSIERPDARARWVNNGVKPDGSRELKLVSYHIRDDYDDEGTRLSEAKPLIEKFERPEDLILTLNGAVCINAKDQRELKRSLAETRAYIKLLKEQCGSECWGL